MNQVIASKRKHFHELVRRQEINAIFAKVRIMKLEVTSPLNFMSNQTLVEELPNNVMEIYQRISQ